MSATPLLQQYFAVKHEYADYLLLFQVGDFYELFFDDAVQASAFLGIALTKRGTHEGSPIPLCGVPVHAVDHYMVKLIKGGFRVAICSQLEEARPGKMVERGITQVLTPGTLTDLKLLSEKNASYCAALFPHDDTLGLLFLELLTGQIWTTVLAADDYVQLEAEFARFLPDEILIPVTTSGKQLEQKIRRWGYTTTLCELQQTEDGANWINRFATSAALSFVQQSPALTDALQLLYSYLRKNNGRALDQCTTLWCYGTDDFLILDARTQRNLELADLFTLMDRAITPMGSRMIKKWLARPLTRKDQIEQRLGAVQFLLANFIVRERLRECLKEIGDIERIIGRIVLQRTHPHDYRALKRALAVLPQIKALLSVQSEQHSLAKLAEGIAPCPDLAMLLERGLNEEPGSDWIIKPGYHAELDRFRSLTTQGTQAIAAFERQEQERTGIGSLKIVYNKIFGYTIEITNTHKDAVPAEYVRLQTLVNRERFTVPALRDLEQDIVRAQKECGALEQELYRDICMQVEQQGAVLKRNAQLLAQCDALIGLATLAHEEQYTRPHFQEINQDIVIKRGKHPVIAKALGTDFIPNDTLLTQQARTWIITGPNMGGKSTYLRQVALIVIMAQMGSFVPAQEAILPICDRIFTRIGAADQLAQGKSTFLVEMEETAIICNRATEQSLVILDEVGRGTSTYDGMAIAQAVLEYLHEKIQPRALFATHYHELTTLTEQFPGIVSYHAASAKTADGIVLLHQIIPGKGDGSFGIEVAKNAQLPPEVIARASEIVKMHGIQGCYAQPAKQGVPLSCHQ